jgi:hypothetical protein
MEGSVRHGHTLGPRGATKRSPTYNTWRSMVSRCTCKTDTAFPNYGGRGVAVCDRWRVFTTFLEDMGQRPEGMTLDRIDPAGNYEPSNCRWASRTVQGNNKRNTHLIEVNGLALSVADWARHLSKTYKQLAWRVEKQGERGLVEWLKTAA